MPGKLSKYFEFLRDYKIPDGKPVNQFAFDGKLLNRVCIYDINQYDYSLNAV